MLVTLYVVLNSPGEVCYPTAMQNQKCDLYTPSFSLSPNFLPASSPIGSLISFESAAARSIFN